MKKEISVSKAHRLINHGSVVLVTSQNKAREPNILAVAWVTPLSQNPPLAGISIAESHYSHQLIDEGGEFVINVPSADLAPKVLLCGQTTGKEEDKFKLAHLTPIPAKNVKSPLIDECVGHLECVIHKRVQCGDHGFFIGEVIAASVEENLFQTAWQVREGLYEALHHLGGKMFAVSKCTLNMEYNDDKQ